MWFKIIKMIKYKHAQEKKWPRPSIDEKIVRDTCLCPKGPSILAFYWLQKEKIKLSLPYPPMQCCAAVKATIGKTTNTQILNGAREGCGLLCCLKLSYSSMMCQQFSLSPIIDFVYNTVKIHFSLSVLSNVPL